MLLYIRLIKESFSFAMNALRNNKLRTMLSLLGVTIGIFSIIAVLAAVDSLDRKIKNDMSSLDKNTMYVTSVSFGPSDVPQWKREQFPMVSYEEYQYLKSSLKNVENTCFQFFSAPQNIKFESKTVYSVNVVPVTNEFADIQRLEFGQGRFFNEPNRMLQVRLSFLVMILPKVCLTVLTRLGKMSVCMDSVLRLSVF